MAGVLASRTETVSPRLSIEFGVAAAQGAMNDRGPIREDARRALKQCERGERLEIRGITVEVDVVRGHGQVPGRESQPSAVNSKFLSLLLHTRVGTSNSKTALESKSC